MTTKRYALTQRAKRTFAHNARRMLERKGYKPSEVFETFYAHSDRWATIIPRWGLQHGYPTIYTRGEDEEVLLNRIRNLYIDAQGQLPDHVLKRPAGKPPVQYPLCPDVPQVVPNSFQHQDGNATSSGEGSGGNTSKRVHSDWSDMPEAEARYRFSGNEEPLESIRGYSTKFVNENIPYANQLLAKLRRALLTDSKCRVSRYRDSGSIDLTRLTDICQLTDVNTIYKRIKTAKRLDVCVQIYIDESGSMNDRCSLPNGKRGDRMQIAAATAACLSKVMRQLKIPHQLIVFSYSTRVVKNWQSRWEDSQLVDAAPDGGTYAPNALSQRLPDMANRREKRKVVVVLTDGDLSEGNDFYSIGGELESYKRKGYEFYSVGLGCQVLSCNPSTPDIDYWSCVGVGNRVRHWVNEDSWRRGEKHIRETVGFNGGIDNVTGKNLLPKLSEHLVEVFTQGRQSIR